MYYQSAIQLNNYYSYYHTPNQDHYNNNTSYSIYNPNDIYYNYSYDNIAISSMERVDDLAETKRSFEDAEIEIDFEAHSTPAQQSNKKKFKKYDDIKCGVCSDASSGFHYGAYTCEACKLFFTRITKNKRKRKFEACVYKNCEIKVETRSFCCECRFKKCIAIGMSMTRSKYGRHTDDVIGRNRIFNLNLKLVDLLLNETKPKLIQILLLNNLSSVRDIVKEFYMKSNGLLRNEETSVILNNGSYLSSPSSSNSLSSSSSSSSSSFNYSFDSTVGLGQYKFMDSYNDRITQMRLNQEQLKYNGLFVLFSVLFDLNISNMYYNYEFNGYKTLELKLKQLISLLETHVLSSSMFSLSLKVCCYVHVMNNLMKDNLIEDIEVNMSMSMNKDGDCQCQERILDLIRSEMVSINTNGDRGKHDTTFNSSSTELVQWMGQIQNILISYL